MLNYTYQEAIENRFLRHLKPQFDLGNNPSNEALLIRLLVGTVKITNTFTTDSFDQCENYSILGKVANSPISTRPLKECVEPETTHTKLCSYIDSSRNINNEF